MVLGQLPAHKLLCGVVYVAVQHRRNCSQKIGGRLKIVAMQQILEGLFYSPILELTQVGIQGGKVRLSRCGPPQSNRRRYTGASSAHFELHFSREADRRAVLGVPVCRQNPPCTGSEFAVSPYGPCRSRSFWPGAAQRHCSTVVQLPAKAPEVHRDCSKGRRMTSPFMHSALSARLIATVEIRPTVDSIAVG